MSLKHVTPGHRRPSRTKSLALAVFRGVRTAQRVALEVPVVAQATAQEIAEAWRESGATPEKKRVKGTDYADDRLDGLSWHCSDEGKAGPPIMRAGSPPDRSKGFAGLPGTI
jgi:hypothetical protein